MLTTASRSVRSSPPFDRSISTRSFGRAGCRVVLFRFFGSSFRFLAVVSMDRTVVTDWSSPRQNRRALLLAQIAAWFGSHSAGFEGEMEGGGGRREARLEAPCALERNVRPTRPGLGGGRSKGLETKGIEHSPPPPPAILGGEPRRCLSPTPNARLVSRSTTRAEGGEMSWTHKSTKRSPLRRVISQSEKRMNESLASFVSRGVMRRLVGRSARLETATTTTNGADPRVAR